jgi:CheY-like chemotaxis protein
MSLKIFVADDSVTIQKIVSLAFSGEDVVVKAVSDGSSALESIRGFKPDVVLADIFMPGCNGYEVCEQIKGDPELDHIPVILMVGTFEPFDEAEASRVKCDRYLTKPFDTSELIQTVHSLVQTQEQRLESDIPSAVKAKEESKKSESQVRYLSSKKLVTPAAWESFLGEARILDLFEPMILPSVEVGAAAEMPSRPATNVASEPQISEESINLIVDRVVRKMSSEVIREIAWEVVPELSESIVRNTAQEQK